MSLRTRTGGAPAKARRRKTLKRRTAAKAVVRRGSSAVSQETQVALISRERDEALEQLAAASEILKVISASPGDLKPVFDTILKNATRICEANFATLLLHEGDAFRAVALHNAPPAYIEERKHDPSIRPTATSALGRLAATKRVVHIADLRTDPSYLDGSPGVVVLVEAAGARSYVAVPMLKEDELIGAIIVYRQEVRPFTDKQIALVQNFAAQAVIAIENTRLLSELRQSLEQQTATADVLRVISTSPGELEPVFQAMLENAVRICGAKFGNVYRWDGDALRLAGTHNTPPALAELRRQSPFRPSPKTPLGRVIATNAVVHVVDATTEPTYIEQREPGIVAAIELAGMRTYVGVPMLKEDELIGVLTVYRQEVRPFTDKQIELLQNFAAQAVIAIENTRLLNELRQRTDDLTESLEQQTATAEVLRVISSSPGELGAGFPGHAGECNAHLRSQVRLHAAARGRSIRRMAMHNAPPEFAKFHKADAGCSSCRLRRSLACHGGKTGCAHCRSPGR